MLKMSNLEENVDSATRQAGWFFRGNDYKDLQRICLGNFLSNWDVLEPIGGIAVDEVHTEIHW